MIDISEEQDGNLTVGFATWVFLLHTVGVEASDAAVAGACQAISDASDEASGDAAGLQLIEAVRGQLQGTEPVQVVQSARALYGDAIGDDLGAGSREERLARIRKYQFGRSLPWLARIWERFEGGEVKPSWVLVERVTDEVTAMDPNPWNDIEEERHLPVDDFQVLWELDACSSVFIR